MNTIISIFLALSLTGVPVELKEFSVSAFANSGGVHPFAGLTASGEYTRDGFVACGNSYEFGTMFYVEGKFYACKDRGSAITDKHLDIFMESEEKALNWGRRIIPVVILGR